MSQDDRPGLQVTWQAISKVSAVNADMLYWMRKAGCIQISYGIESGAPQIRKRFRKDINETQIQRAFDLTTAHGIMARAYFIYGAPGGNLGNHCQTLDLIRRIKPLSVIFYILDIFPGQRFTRISKRGAMPATISGLNPSRTSSILKPIRISTRRPFLRLGAICGKPTTACFPKSHRRLSWRPPGPAPGTVRFPIPVGHDLQPWRLRPDRQRPVPAADRPQFIPAGPVPPPGPSRVLGPGAGAPAPGGLDGRHRGHFKGGLHHFPKAGK